MAKKKFVYQPAKRGRPATGRTPKRYFRVNDELWAQIVKAAKISGENTSAYMRRVLEKDASRVTQKRS